MSTTEITLDRPVEIDGTMIGAVVIRRPMIADLAAVNRMNAGRYMRGLKLTSRLTGLTPRGLETIERTNPEAMSRIAKTVREQMDAPHHG